jgi:T5orf172 domain
MSGYIYVLSHELLPNLLKVGFTNRTVEERVKELSATGLPKKFTIELYFETDNAELFEMLLHKSLKEYKFDKEFFKVDLKIVIEYIHILLGTNDIKLNKFYGKSAHLAKTGEQLTQEEKINEERRKRAEDFKNEYLKKTSDELKSVLRELLRNPTTSNLIKAKEISKIINLKEQKEQEDWENSEEYKEIIRKEYLYEKNFEPEFKEIGQKINILLNNKFPTSPFAYMMYFNHKGGLKVFKKLDNEEVDLIRKFYSLCLKGKEFINSYNLHKLNLKYEKYNLIKAANNSHEFSEFFSEILAYCMKRS